MNQPPLPFAHRPGFDAADFLPAAANQDALAWLAAPHWPAGRLLLWGGAGVGKTHLAHAWASQNAAPLLAGAALRGWPSPTGGNVAIDDADQAPPEPLLHLLNAAAERGARVLLAARVPPGRWPHALPDLSSRLGASAIAELREPDDDTLRAIWVRLLADRQLAVADEVSAWLLARLPRQPGALRDAAARLDGLAWGRRVTRALAGALVAEGV